MPSVAHFPSLENTTIATLCTKRAGAKTPMAPAKVQTVRLARTVTRPAPKPKLALTHRAPRAAGTTPALTFSSPVLEARSTRKRTEARTPQRGHLRRKRDRPNWLKAAWKQKDPEPMSNLSDSHDACVPKGANFAVRREFGASALETSSKNSGRRYPALRMVVRAKAIQIRSPIVATLRVGVPSESSTRATLSDPGPEGQTSGTWHVSSQKRSPPALGHTPRPVSTKAPFWASQQTLTKREQPAEFLAQEAIRC
jgi:hypothetical protein